MLEALGRLVYGDALPEELVHHLLGGERVVLLGRDDEGLRLALQAALRLPDRLRDYALLARFDRPIGWWLLFWPCAFGVLLTGAPIGLQWPLLLWLLLGAIAMRGAGCVYNDIIDRKLDAQVARTRHRPLAKRIALIGEA